MCEVNHEEAHLSRSMGASSSTPGVLCDVGTRITGLPLCDYLPSQSGTVPKRRLSDTTVLADIPVPPKGLWSLDGDASMPSLPKTVGYVCKQGKKPCAPNQDDFCIIRTKDYEIYAVVDGHGPCGHKAATETMRNIVVSITEHPKFPKNMAACFADSFRAAQKQCQAVTDAGKYDCSSSGCGISVICIHDDFVETGHIGNTRAVLAGKTGKTFTAYELTKEHRVDLPDERRRIEQCGGVIKSGQGTYHGRVYCYGMETPGLSISRSIGDLVAHNLGVAEFPDTMQRAKETPGFIIVASDGLWSFVKSQEAVDLVEMYPGEADVATNNLYELARKRWTKNDQYIDDITIIVSWF